MAATAALFALRCHSCSHGVGTASEVMEIVGMFRASAFGRVPFAHPLEVRKRCRSCGWVNVFHPPGQNRDLTARRVRNNVSGEAGHNSSGPLMANHAHRAGWPFRVIGHGDPAPTRNPDTP